MLDFYAHGEGQYSGLDGGALHDPMAVATLIDPTIVTTTPLNVQVETSRGSVAYGMTLCDGRGLDAALRPRGPYSQGA